MNENAEAAAESIRVIRGSKKISVAVFFLRSEDWHLNVNEKFEIIRTIPNLKR
jgi:hypothetical protein